MDEPIFNASFSEEDTEKNDTSKHLDMKHILDIMQAAGPYFNGHMQKSLSLFIQIGDLIDTLKHLKDPEPLSTCELENKDIDIEGMLSNIREVCYDSEKEMIDLFLNFMKAQKFYKAYQTAAAAYPEAFSSPTQKEEPDYSGEKDLNSSSFINSDMIDVLKNMLPPEQQASIENLSTMLKFMNTNTS